MKDIAEVYVDSAEQLLDQLAAGDIGADFYKTASSGDSGISSVADTVARLTSEKLDFRPEVELINNPRSSETIVEEFAVDTSNTRKKLDWYPTHSIEESIRDLLSQKE